MLEWTDVLAQLTKARNYWLSTTRANGHPHAAPVWGLWLEGRFCFSTDPASVKARGFGHQAAVVVHLESGDDVVIVEGNVQRLADPGLLRRMGADYRAKYDIEIDFANPDFAVLQVRPEKVLAWTEKDFPSTATRFVPLG